MPDDAELLSTIHMHDGSRVQLFRRAKGISVHRNGQEIVIPGASARQAGEIHGLFEELGVGVEFEDDAAEGE